MWDNFIYYGKINQTETVISVLMGHFIKKLLFILLFVGVLIAPATHKTKRICIRTRKLATSILSALTIILKL